MKNEENMLTARAAELYSVSEFSVKTTDFFTPHDRIEIMSKLCEEFGDGAKRCFFWGGCADTERRCAVFLPEWYMPDDIPPHRMPSDEDRTAAFASYLAGHPEITDEIPISALEIRGSGFGSLTHRDYMGGILSLGIERSVIGDIIVSDNGAVVFVQNRIAEYLCTELTKIGRDAVRVSRIPCDPLMKTERQYEKMSVTVASMRLDGVVHAITGKSRGDAAEMVHAGLVELSYVQTDDVSAPVNEGDIISVRGFGKYVIGAQSGNTKSGRIRLECRKYV